MRKQIYQIGCTIIETCDLSREKYSIELSPDFFENVDEETAAMFATSALYDAIAQLVTALGYECINQNPALYFAEKDYLKANQVLDELNSKISDLYKLIDPAHEFPGMWNCMFALDFGGKAWEGKKYTGKIYLEY